MVYRIRQAGILFTFLLGAIQVVTAAGPLQRLPTTSLTNMPAQPPTLTYTFTFTNAFSTMPAFQNPVAIVTPPGETNRLFVVEKAGRIVVITNLAAPTRSIFMDITSYVQAGPNWFDEEGLLGLAFHPGYATNRYFYVFYTAPSNGTYRLDTLERYQIKAGNTNQGDPASFVTLFKQADEANNHNAGDLHFGPDGYLYVSLGDEGGAQGQYNNSQRIDKDFFSGIMRIDVDKRATNQPPKPHISLAGATNYFVPNDNPWVGATSFNGLSVNSNNVRMEFWAVGLRNPWRFSFDTNGTLYCGDVGQGTTGGSVSHEEVDVILKGRNYGWNYWEGTFQRTNSPPAGFVHTPPIQEYLRLETYAAIIGGVVYRGEKFPQLNGAYIYGDSDDGRIWALKYNGTNVTENNLLFTVPKDINTTDASISAFGVDPRNGDIFFCDLNNGSDSQIKRIISNTSTTNGTPLPSLLSGTGAFTNLTTLAPAQGIVPYDLNVPFWSDNAIKTRWVSVPNTNLTIGFNPTNNWSFPTGSVWIKHFELEVTNGVPASRKRLETRFIIRNTNGVYGVTYRWTTPPTNAVLVAEAGLDEAFTNYNGVGGIIGTQIWHYPSRSECLQCHTAAGGHALGFNTPQLNRDYTYGATTTNQILALSLAGYFNTNVTGVDTMATLAHATNNAASLEFRVRSYLSANCSQCHQPGGSAHSPWNASIWTQMTDAGIINGALLNNLGDTNNRVIVPGSLSNSVLLTRISTPPLRMPPLASSVLDTQAIALVTEWIGSLSGGASNFSLAATPASATLKSGDSTNYTVTVSASNEFSGDVTLSVSGLPAGADYSLNPTNVSSSATSTLNVTSSTNVAAGNYNLIITGISGTLTNNTTVTLSVNDFSLSALPISRAVTVGGNDNYAVTVGASNSFSGDVTLSVSGLPAGAGYSLSPTNLSGSGASTLNVTTSTNVAVGNYVLTITGTSGGLIHSTTVTLSVNDFDVSVAPALRTVMAGYDTNYTVIVGASNGFSGNVTLSAIGLPAEGGYSLNPTNVDSSGTSTLNVTTVNNISPGDYVLTIIGTSGGLTRNATVTLQVVALPTPRFTAVTLSETSLVLSGTNGIPNGNYYVLDSTNLALPLFDWTRLATNAFDANGDFAFTNVLDPNTPQLFYRLQLP